MIYPKLNLIIHMVKNGFECDNDIIEEVEFSIQDIEYMKKFPFIEKDFGEWFGDFFDDLVYNNRYNILKKMIDSDIISFKDTVKIYSEYYGLNDDFIKTIENLDWFDEDDINEISEEHSKIYLKYKDDLDKNKVELLEKNIMSTEEYYTKVFNEEFKELDEDEIIKFFQRDDFDAFNYLTKDILLSKGFLNSFDNFPRRGKTSYSDYIEPKHEIAYILWEHFDYDEEIRAVFLRDLSYVYDEHLETSDEEATRLAKEEEYNRIENVIKRAQERNRISADDANRIIKEKYQLDNFMNVHDGHVGLEDMTFATIHIKGDIFEYYESFGRHWISGRNFGDNQISWKQFERAIEYAQSLKENKE